MDKFVVKISKPSCSSSSACGSELENAVVESGSVSDRPNLDTTTVHTG